MANKVINILLNNVTLEKVIVKLYPDLEYKYMKTILNFLIYSKKDLLIDEMKNLYKKHIPKIYELIDWDLYYDYCIINDYLGRFEEKTGLVGSDLLNELSNNKIGWMTMQELMSALRRSDHRTFVKLFKQHFRHEMIEENSLETHTKYVEREKKLKRILSQVEL